MGQITSSIVRALAALAIVFIVAGAALAWRLAAGPVSLAFLTPYLEEALNQGSNREVSIQLGDTMLTWAGWRRTLDIRARDVVVVDSDGVEIAELPEISIGLSGRALLESRLRPRSIDVLGAEAVIIRHSDGSVGLGFGEASVQEDDNVLLSRLLNELLVPPDAAASTGSLSRISILDSNLTFIDQVNGALWRAPTADLVLLRRGQSIEGDARLEINFGGRRAKIAGTISYDSVSGNAQVNTSFDDLYLPDVARQGRVLSDLSGIEIPISGSLRLAVDAEGAVSDVVFSITGHSGFIDLPEVFDERFPVVRATAHGTFSWPTLEANISELAVDLGGTLFTARGIAALAGSKPGFAGDVRILDLPVARLPAYWPRDFGTNARAWVAERVREGRIVESTIRVGGTKNTDSDAVATDVAIDFTFSGLGSSFVDELPPLTGAAGSGRIAEDRLEVSIESGELAGLAVSDLSVAITDLSLASQEAAVEFVLRGPLAEVMEVLESPSLGIAGDLGFPSKTVGGVVAARARITLPLTEQGTPLESVNYAAAANLADVKGELPFPQIAFDRGTLSLRLDRNGFDVDGAIFIQDTPVTVQWRQDLNRDNGPTSRFLLRAQMDEAGRARLGFGTGGAVDGFVDVSVDVAAGDGALQRAVVDVNFLGATIDIPALHWSKAQDRAARGRAVVIPQPDGSVVVDALEFRADDLVATGQLELDADAAIRRFDLSRLTLAGSDLSVSMRPRAPDGFIVALEGRRLDFSPYLADILDGADEPLPPLELSLRVDEFVIGQGEGLLGLEGKARFDGKHWSDVSMTGRFGATGKPLVFAIRTEDGVRNVSVKSDDAGSVAQAIGFYDNAVGGDLIMSAVVDDSKPGSPIKGNVKISEFTLVKAPTLTRILTLASLEGVLGLLSGGQGISFVGLEMPFELENGSLRVAEARAFGPALGITANGTFALETEETNFAGTIVPAYTVNSLLGNIPVLGNLLIGGKGEGVFALTYTVRGNADAPDVQVNPLSALAPGFLRRLVTLLDRQPKTEGKPENTPAEESAVKKPGVSP